VSDEDAKLVKAALAGSTEAFDQLVQQYQRRAVAVASRLLRNLDDAMEVAQEAFIRAYQALGQLNDPRRFGPWLLRIVANQALNFRRSHSRDPKISLDRAGGEDEESPTPLMSLAGAEPTALEHVSAQELAEALEKAIRELPENLRDALVLFAIEKLPQKEIADIMDCSLQTVKWSVFEARRRLREKLDKWL
jgi:RNA polymerase sigma-70 factor (ECF subfamily)